MTGAAQPPAPSAGAGSAAPIGLVAGSGRFPLLFAEAASRAGREVVAVAHEGETDAELARIAPRCTWVRLGQLGRIVEILREGGCAEAVFCGGIRKPSLFDVRPDWLGLKVLAGLRSFGDDAALRAIASALEAEGVRIISPVPLMPGLLAPRGPLGKRALSVEQRADVEVGLRAARLLGELDLGQTVVVKRGVVLAVEAIEGTDACIDRGGRLAKGGGHGAVVVKVQKPAQDERFDLPAIGPKTVAALQAAGCSALAVEAGRAVVLDRAALALAADAAGIAVEGV
jgi:UDP-2,3-diacylglucosamine hydrolase